MTRAQRKARKFTVHHLTPRCHRKPGYIPRMPDMEQLLTLTGDRHKAWHLLFKEADLQQVIAILKRIERIKSRGR